MREYEIWVPVVVNGEKYENYQVSNLGEVRSLDYNHTGQTKILKPGKDKDGYLQVCLSKNGRRKNFFVHRLVSQTFIPNLLDYQEVNHIDEDKANNNVDNLEWCDHKENINHGTRNQRAAEKLTNGKLSKPVLQLTKTGKLVKEWPSTKECGRNGFDSRNVASCCRGIYKHHKGYIWRYK